MSQVSDVGRYRDYSKVIRELERAEESHQLDRQGHLDELAKACAASDTKIAYHNSEREAWYLARCAYFEEARRLTALSNVESGLRSAAKRFGTFDPVVKEGFYDFCRRVGVSQANANEMARVARSENPAAAYEANKKKRREEKAARKTKRMTTHAPAVNDPLSAVKREWLKLTAVKRLEFLDWAEEVLAEGQGGRVQPYTHQEERASL